MMFGLLLLAFGFGRKTEESTPVVPAESPDPPEVEAIPPGIERLFPDGVPADHGGIPRGLANASAQGCNACHYAAHDEWARSSHATGWQSPAFRAAVEEAATPACTACHLPLAVQAPQRVQYDNGDVNQPVFAANAQYDATLQGEGVTCAACHIREGAVVATRHGVQGPHATTWSPELSSSEACGTCHQLTWPGATMPFYDTFGEWQRSATAAAGIGCVDCHMRSGTGPSHAFEADPSRALSVLLEIDGGLLHRGGEPLQVAIRLQNTGAGHAFPTGTPFRGVSVTAQLVVDTGGEKTTEVGAPFSTDLVAEVSSEPPWALLNDTRLAAGGERRYEFLLKLPADAPAGHWGVRVTLSETRAGAAAGEPFWARLVPLTVD